MSKTLKILVCGDVEGKLTQLYKRIAGIQKKAGSFDMLFCVGNFFGDTDEEWKQYQSGALKAPISTLILGPNKEKHTEYFPDIDGCELCHNITYLGKKGVYTESSGLTIAYLGGRDGMGGSISSTHFTDPDCQALQVPAESDSKYKGVDLFLTSTWPTGVERYGLSQGGSSSEDYGSDTIAQVALTLRPRYHFSALEGLHYERQPYRNHKVLAEGARHVTRFIGLAKVGNEAKKKYLYAFNITPMKHLEEAELVQQPPDVTECPYKTDSNSGNNQQGEKAAQFFFADGKQGKKRQGKPGEGPQGKKRPPPKPTGPCWFCLGSPEVEKHLVVSVAGETYLALAKGGLTKDHLLICPIGHHQSLVSAPQEVIDEIEQYKTAVKKCLRSHGKTAVFFERNYKTQHLQIQVVPIPQDQAGEVRETMEGLGLSQNIELQEVPKHSDLKQIVPEGAPYFYAELPSGEKLLYRISRGFPLQFGREALADQTLLNMPDRVDWRNCKTSKEEETEFTKDFRKIFEQFDISDM